MFRRLPLNYYQIFIFRRIFMKKLLVVLCVSFIGISFFGCASAPAKTAPARINNSRVPAFIKDAMVNVAEDELIGIGAAKMSSISMSMTTASTRARAAISQQLSTMIKNMVTDFTAESEGNAASALNFQENITQALSKSNLVGSHVVIQDEGSDGTYWFVVSMSKSNVAKEINSAGEAAKLNNAQMKAFDATSRMEAAFRKLAGEEPVLVEK
jgi:hypothetical protein